MDTEYLLYCFLCFTIFKGELVFNYFWYIPGSAITGSTCNSFLFYFFITAHASGYTVVEKLFLKMKIIVTTVKDTSF